MLVDVDVEKWKQHKDYYDRKYCEYVKKNWMKQHKFLNQRLLDTKNEKRKDVYNGLLNQSTDNLFKIDSVIEDL